MNEIKTLAVMVDERLAELLDARFTHEQTIMWAADSIRRAAGQKKDRVTGLWDGEWTDAVAAAEGNILARRSLEEYRHHSAQMQQIKHEYAELNMVWLEERWTRAFLVINSNGHIHSSMDCTTCFDSTRYEWLTAYSADDEATIVAAAGETACTVCYPSAPADILNRPSTIQSKARAEKEAAAAARAEAKAKREAKRIASAPTATGESIFVPSTWRDGRPEEIKTERTAVSEWYTRQDYIGWAMYADRAHEMRVGQRIIEEALAGKRGVSVEEVRADLLARHAKRK